MSLSDLAVAFSRLVLRSGPKDRVSKDGAATVPAPWFETRAFGALLTMRPIQAYTNPECVSASRDPARRA
jgi:hypothetical protein